MGFWLNQALGLLGSLIVFASVQFNNRRVILAAQAAACLMWIVHYGLLGATTAATGGVFLYLNGIAQNHAAICCQTGRLTSQRMSGTNSSPGK